MTQKKNLFDSRRQIYILEPNKFLLDSKKNMFEPSIFFFESSKFYLTQKENLFDSRRKIYLTQINFHLGSKRHNLLGSSMFFSQCMFALVPNARAVVVSFTFIDFVSK